MTKVSSLGISPQEIIRIGLIINLLDTNREKYASRDFKNSIKETTNAKRDRTSIE